ncbi:MAG: hypothetical protein EAX90_10325 [Candidatus Heimdallarchaeota archaeon]|nr:hypothetical protein [Candidatus Heimdallarchaeota archaeon]
MKVLTIYYSESGQTEKIAKIFHEEISKKHESDLKKLSETKMKTITDYDLVFIGSPCHSSDLARPIKKFLSKLPENPKFKMVGFFTHSCYTKEENEKLYEEWVGKCIPSFTDITNKKNIEFLGYFNCMGAATPAIEKFIHRKIITDDDEWKTYLPKLKLKPDNQDLNNARNFVGKIMDKLS